MFLILLQVADLKFIHIINSIVYMRFVFSILISAKDRFFCV